MYILHAIYDKAKFMENLIIIKLSKRPLVLLLRRLFRFNIPIFIDLVCIYIKFSIMIELYFLCISSQIALKITRRDDDIK